MPEYLNIETGLTRRALVRTAAWTVPVIAAAVATPMTAASEEGKLTNVSAGYYAIPGQYLFARANSNGPVNPRPENFVVSGTPAVHVVDVVNYSHSSLNLDLTIDAPISSDVGRTLTISLPGFAPVTTPLIY